MKEATIRLQGNAVDGVFGALWEVLPSMESLLNGLEAAKERLNNAVASHFKAMVYLAWRKLDQYYALTDDSYAYITAVPLNPCLKLNWIRHNWKDREDWVTNAEKTVKDTYLDYCKKAALPRSEPPPRSVNKQKTASRIDQNLYFSSSDDDSAYNEPTEWDRFFGSKREKNDRYIKNPLQWWRDNHMKYPILSQMAFDLFGCPAMSSACERAFSKAGGVLNTQRPRLSAEMGEAQLLIASWIKSGIITHEIGEKLLMGVGDEIDEEMTNKNDISGANGVAEQEEYASQ